MKALLVLCALVAVSSAQIHYFYGSPVVHGSHYRSQNNLGQYSYGYSAADGSSKHEARGADGNVAGGYSYTGADGKKVHVTYTAGAEGFQASSNVQPQPVQPTAEVAEATQKHLAAKSQAATQAASPVPVVHYAGYPYHHAYFQNQPSNAYSYSYAY